MSYLCGVKMVKLMNMNTTQTVDGSVTTIYLELPKCDLAFLRKLAANMGWTIPQKRKMTGIERALEDVKQGRVTTYESVDDFFKEMGI